MSNDISIINESLPKVRSAEASFFYYLQEIHKFPILTAEQEQEYGERYQANGDKEAAKMLIQSHLRLVVTIAGKFRSYGLPIVDLVSEGNVGLIQAVKKFDATKGFRFSTYAMWWIKAYIQEYILRSWSLVKIGTTTAQRKLFFNLRKIKNRLGIKETGALLPEEISKIADDLNVPEREVVTMHSRMQNSDSSLNQKIGDEEDGVEFGEKIADQAISQEQISIENQEKSRREELLKQAMLLLNEREKEIVIKRKLSEKAPTLEDLSKIYKVSKERVRQIEEAAINKIRKFIQSKI